MEQVSISGRDGQTPSNHSGTTNLLNVLNLPAPPRSTVVKVAGNGVPRAVVQGRVALLPGLEVPRVLLEEELLPAMEQFVARTSEIDAALEVCLDAKAQARVFF